MSLGFARDVGREKKLMNSQLYTQKKVEDKITDSIPVLNALRMSMQRECERQETLILKNINNIKENIGQCFLNVVNDKKEKVILSEDSKCLTPMVDNCVDVAERLKSPCLPLTISIMMAIDTGTKSMVEKDEKKVLIFIHGLLKTIFLQDFKFFAITAISANTDAKVFVPINSKKVQRLSERSRDQAIPKRTTSHKKDDDIVPSLERSKAVSKRDGQRLAISVEDIASGKMSEQRVPYSVREEARMGLSDWLAARIDAAFFNQLAGNTGISDTKKTGNNATVAPDNNHWILATGVAGTNVEASLSASSVFSLTLIDRAVTKAKTISPMIRPLKIGGEDKFVCFIHPFQHYQLRQQTGAAQYMDIQKAALQGGQRSGNPIYSGAKRSYGSLISDDKKITPLIAGKSYNLCYNRIVRQSAAKGVYDGQSMFQLQGEKAA